MRQSEDQRLAGLPVQNGVALLGEVDPVRLDIAAMHGKDNALKLAKALNTDYRVFL